MMAVRCTSGHDIQQIPRKKNERFFFSYYSSVFSFQIKKHTHTSQEKSEIKWTKKKWKKKIWRRRQNSYNTHIKKLFYWIFYTISKEYYGPLILWSLCQYKTAQPKKLSILHTHPFYHSKNVYIYTFFFVIKAIGNNRNI